MAISRISKAVAERRRYSKFQEAEDVRNKDIDLLLPVEISDTVRVMAQTATALALRCFTGKVRIHGAGLDSPLRSLLQGEAEKYGTPERLEFCPKKRGAWCLALGYQVADAICADASGWTARINGAFTKRTPAAPPAITFTVACALAKLFNQAIFEVNTHAFEAWDYCLLRSLAGEHTPIEDEPQVDLGKVGLLGAGAIGSAVGYVLSISSWSGQVDIIDFDTFEDPNLETCILADYRDVNRPLRKALAIANAFEGRKIVATERRCKVGAGETILLEQRNAFICGVDNPETRTFLDNVNAPILLNAGLGATNQDSGWILWTQHGPGDPTLSSIYGGQAKESTVSDYVPEEFREECSRKNYHGVSLALPFAALAAGSLLAAALYRNAVGSQSTIAYLQMDLLRKQQRMTYK